MPLAIPYDDHGVSQLATRAVWDIQNASTVELYIEEEEEEEEG